MSPWNQASQTYVCDRCAEHMTEAEYQQAGLCDGCSEKGYQLVALRPGFWTLVDKRGRELKDITMEQPTPPQEDTMPSFPHQQPAVDPPTEDDEDSIDVDDVDSQPEDPNPDAAMEAELDREPIVLAHDTDWQNGDADAGEDQQKPELRDDKPDPEPTTHTAPQVAATFPATGVIEHRTVPSRPTKAELRDLVDQLRLYALQAERYLITSDDTITRAKHLGESHGLRRAMAETEKRFHL